ncbi:LOW QUALITY PROTEIN: RNA-binding motif protein, X-linked 2-like [Physeter macrocephalus]|uniref:LOW QUALITY PROTEIN: RNA-binding motif protein, X-linked 2-like n=1 Tax=Physeter macrocephalus TaxID=9755 RepID=A0A9W2WS80_PHYMC|nr:LOW QUALITY PROTEIN: RNA-binding motif protein, X-linked 2-like [Physeter catodon]
MAAECIWGEQGRDGSPALKVFTRSSALLRPPEVGFAQALGCSCVVPQAREMNRLTKLQLVNKLNEWEAGTVVIAEASWHSEYKDSAWIFLGGLSYELTEGDSLCVFSQYRQIVSISRVRDRKTGKSKGFCFICYEDQRSTSLTVDNFNGIKIKGRTIQVNHVPSYRRPPRASEDVDDATRKLWEKGYGAQIPLSSSSDSLDDEALSEWHKREKQRRKNIKVNTDIQVKDEEGQISHGPCQPEARF